MTKPQPKPWPCNKETSDGNSCEAILGYIVRGELTFEGKAMTDNIYLNILCPQCGQVKTWFPQPQKILGQFGKALVDEIQLRVIRRERQ